MSAKPLPPDDLWAMIPPKAQAVIVERVASFEQRIAALEARLNRTSPSSSRPQSTEPLPSKRQLKVA